MNRMRIEKNTKFATVKKAYLNVDLENCKSLTQYVDALLFKSRDLNEILALVIEAKAIRSDFAANRDFATVTRIASHIAYRQRHDKFAVNKTKENKVRYIKLES